MQDFDTCDVFFICRSGHCFSGLTIKIFCVPSWWLLKKRYYSVFSDICADQLFRIFLFACRSRHFYCASPVVFGTSTELSVVTFLLTHSSWHFYCTRRLWSFYRPVVLWYQLPAADISTSPFQRFYWPFIRYISTYNVVWCSIVVIVTVLLFTHLWHFYVYATREIIFDLPFVTFLLICKFHWCVIRDIFKHSPVTFLWINHSCNFYWFVIHDIYIAL